MFIQMEGKDTASSLRTDSTVSYYVYVTHSGRGCSRGLFHIDPPMPERLF